MSCFTRRVSCGADTHGCQRIFLIRCNSWMWSVVWVGLCTITGSAMRRVPCSWCRAQVFLISAPGLKSQVRRSNRRACGTPDPYLRMRERWVVLQMCRNFCLISHPHRGKNSVMVFASHPGRSCFDGCGVLVVKCGTFLFCYVSHKLFGYMRRKRALLAEVANKRSGHTPRFRGGQRGMCRAVWERGSSAVMTFRTTPLDFFEASENQDDEFAYHGWQQTVFFCCARESSQRQSSTDIFPA